MLQKFYVIGLILCLSFLCACKQLNCYDTPSNENIRILEKLNLKFENIDTIYFNDCLSGYVHLYTKDGFEEIDTSFLYNLHKELNSNHINSDIWSFNNKSKFLFRTVIYNGELVFRENQYIEQ